MARATSILCPQCGAQLDPPEGEERVRCGFCGTTSEIASQPKALPFRRQQEAEQLRAEMLALRQQGRGTSVIGAVIAVVVAVVAGGFALSVAGSAVLVGVGLSAESPSWDGNGGPIVYDVNADGTDDVVGWCRYVMSGDTVALCALDGKSGASLWETERLGPRDQHYTSELLRFDDVLVEADERGGVTGRKLATGESVWRVELGERSARWCGDAEGGRVQTADQRWKLVRKDGTSKDSGAPADCLPLPRDHREQPGVASVLWVAGQRTDVSGMRVDHLLARPDSDERIAIGTRSPGTSVPMAAKIRGSTVAWTAVIPDKPLEAHEGAPAAATLSADQLVVAYQLDEPGGKVVTHLAAFADGNGLKRWDVAMPDGFMSVVGGMTAGKDRVFVYHWGRLEAFDLATGAVLWRVGS